MMKFLIIFVVLFVKTNGSICVTWKDTFFKLDYHNNRTIINVYSHLNQQYMMFGFGNKHLYPDFLLENNNNKINEITNTNYTITLDDSIRMHIDNILHFDVSGQNTSMINFIFITQNYNDSDMIEIDLNKTEFKEIGWCSPTYLKLPGRLLSIHIGLLIPYLSFIIFIIIACVNFRNEQPLKSRGESPFVMTFTYMIPLISEYILAFGFDYDQQYHISCFVSTYLLYIPTQISIIIMFVHYLRYIIIINIQVNKIKHMKKQTNLQSNLLIRTLSKITHPISIVLIPLIWIITYVIIVTVVFTAYNFKCGNLASSINRFITIGFCVIICVCVALLQIWDYIRNYKLLLKCDLKTFFLTNDHYYYRLEFLPTPIVFLLSAFWLFLPVPTTFSIIICDIINIIALWVGCLFILSITILKYYYKLYFYVKKDYIHSESIFQTPELLELLIDFSKNEWSIENVYFKIYCTKYKNSNKEDRMKIAKEIRILFLSFNESTFEVNMKKNLITNVNNIIDTTTLYPDNLFNDLEDENRLLLNDIYYRFYNSFEYQLYNQKMLLIQNNK